MARTRWRVCSRSDCPEPYRDATKSGKCPAHRSEHERQRGTATQRGYDSQHRATRAALLPRFIGLPCAICGDIMQAGDALDLDHTVPLMDDPASKGDRIVHAGCNRGRRTT